MYIVCTKARVLFIGCTVLCVLAYMGFCSDWFQKKFIYPYPYKEMVVEYSGVRNLDSNLVAGVILSESKFKLAAKSHKGAIGLMQIMPKTAQWIAEQMEDKQFSLAVLHDPEVNIKFGTWYLQSLKKEFSGNEVLMLAAYNAGRGNVKDWMEKYQWDMNFKDIEQIPYRETRQYVKKVLESKVQYQKLYTEN